MLPESHDGSFRYGSVTLRGVAQRCPEAAPFALPLLQLQSAIRRIVKLKVLLSLQLFTEMSEVSRIVAQTPSGRASQDGQPALDQEGRELRAALDRIESGVLHQLPERHRER
jgi:hypothetical protein